MTSQVPFAMVSDPSSLRYDGWHLSDKITSTSAHLPDSPEVTTCISSFDLCDESGPESDLSATILSQKIMSTGNFKSHKRVRFRPDIPSKFRPTASNLRPMRRLVRKEGMGADTLTTLLNHWDDTWRSYLKAYYDDQLFLQSAVGADQLPEMMDVQNMLSLLANKCREMLSSVMPQYSPESCSTISKTGARNLGESRKRKAEAAPFDEALSNLRVKRHELVRTLVNTVCEWSEIEQQHWATSGTRSNFRSRDPHQDFCSFVDKIDVYQRRLKSLADFERRLCRKVQKFRCSRGVGVIPKTHLLIQSSSDIERSCLDELRMITHMRPLAICATAISE